jgi:hypothetical protein
VGAFQVNEPPLFIYARNRNRHHIAPLRGLRRLPHLSSRQTGKRPLLWLRGVRFARPNEKENVRQAEIEKKLQQIRKKTRKTFGGNKKILYLCIRI